MEQTIEEVRDITSEVFKASERLALLEKDAAFVTDFLVTKEKTLSERINDTDEHIATIKETMLYIEKNLKNCSIAFDIMVHKLKETAQQSTLERFQQRVDQWNPEGFITKYELRKTLEEKP